MWYNAVDKINKEAPSKMKRKVTLLTVLMLTLSMLFALTACNSYGSIKKAYEDAGYTENETFQSYQADIVEALGEDFESVCTVHVFQKGLIGEDFAVILEFHSTKDLEEAYENSATLQGLAEDLQKSDRVKGNCFLFLYNPIIGNSFSTFVNA